MLNTLYELEILSRQREAEIQRKARVRWLHEEAIRSNRDRARSLLVRWFRKMIGLGRL
jgi:hypothetical protein